MRLLVAEGPEGPLGLTGYGPSRDPDALTPVGELRSIFVRPSAWGSGVAAALFDAAVEELRELGYEEFTLWTLVGNERAGAFYERRGMRRDGARKREAAWGDVDQVRLRMRLAPARPL